MRTAIVSDIHGNLTAFEAVLADLRNAAPDLILHGGDLADGGAGAVEIVDRIRSLGWSGIVGNTDEMLFRPASLQDFASKSPQLKSLFDAVEEMAAFARAALGADRLAWLNALPPIQRHENIALVHGSPTTCWNAPAPEATDAEFKSGYEQLESTLVVYGHVHRPFIRSVDAMTIANSGSVGLPYDGDRRASYLLIDDGTPSIRRVEYDIEREIKTLAACGLPHADWVSKMLSSGRPAMP